MLIVCSTGYRHGQILYTYWMAWARTPVRHAITDWTRTGIMRGDGDPCWGVAQQLRRTPCCAGVRSSCRLVGQDVLVGPE